MGRGGLEERREGVGVEGGILLDGLAIEDVVDGECLGLGKKGPTEREAYHQIIIVSMA